LLGGLMNDVKQDVESHLLHAEADQGQFPELVI